MIWSSILCEKLILFQPVILKTSFDVVCHIERQKGAPATLTNWDIQCSKGCSNLIEHE
jgi:hypothetical protein